MTSTVDIGKLAELREKTDRDLVRIIGTELERGLILASVASEWQSPLYARAESVYRKATASLSKVYGMSPADRALLEGKLAELRQALDLAAGQTAARQMTAR
jgi:hypothetical protein